MLVATVGIPVLVADQTRDLTYEWLIQGIGGLVLSPVTQKLIDEVGIRWTLRIMSLLTFVGML